MWHLQLAGCFYGLNIDETFVFKLIEEKGIALVPGSAFGSEGKGYVRIALVQEKELLKKALKKLAN